MPTATLIQHRGKRFESRIAIAQGLPGGEKFYRVDTADDEAAMAAALVAVPLGTAYSGSFPTALSQDYDIAEQMGTFTTVRIGFGTQSSTGSIDATATSTTAFHAVNNSAAQQEIYADISGNAIPRTTKPVPARELVVTGYRTGAQWNTFLTHWNSIAGKRNSNSVVIPAKPNVSGSGFTAAASELLALTFNDETVKENLIKVEMRFAFGPAGTHAFTYRNLDASGTPTGSPVTRQIHETATYTAGSMWG